MLGPSLGTGPVGGAGRPGWRVEHLPPRPTPFQGSSRQERGGDVLDTGSLPALPRAERSEVLDTWLAGLLDEAGAGTPPPRSPRGGEAPPLPAAAGPPASAR